MLFTKKPHVNYKDTDSFKGNRWGKDANINYKKAGMTILISAKQILE